MIAPYIENVLIINTVAYEKKLELLIFLFKIIKRYNMFDSLAKAGKYLGQAAKLMVGIPDYDNYVQHMKLTHPEQTPMTYEEFFKERQDARYGGKGGFKCC